MTKSWTAHGAAIMALLFSAAMPAAAQVRRQTPDTPPPRIDPVPLAPLDGR